MTEMFDKTRKYVYESFKGNKAQMKHFDRTVYWVQQLKPDADEAFLIAAISHDIERAFRSDNEGFNREDTRFTDEETLKYHQEKGAQIIGEYLADLGADEALIAKVKHLIEKHEVGGDDDQNLLMDADSLSFVENNAQIFIRRLPELGYEKIREKFDWMFNRISNEKAKEIARPFYENMLKELDRAA